MNKCDQKKNKIIGVIPARWSSSRFPGKILAPVLGRPLICRVLDAVLKARELDAVYVAADDARIREVVEEMGVSCILTPPELPSGTDRIARAVEQVEGDIVVNIQGDEPLMDPGLIDRLTRVFTSGEKWDMATAVTAFDDSDDVSNPSVVKAVFSASGRALYFSRAPIPYQRDKDENHIRYWRHIGVYAYTRSFLRAFVQAPPCEAEKAEKLEQLRALHIGCRMKVIQTEYAGLGVDEPGDIAKVEQLLENRRL